MTPEPYPLINADFRVKRAQVHLNELRALVEGFESDPYELVTDEDVERDQVRYEFHIKEPHVTVFLIAADVIQCLRTALDQAVFSLASIKIQDPVWTQFPVFAEPLSSDDTKRFDRQTKGLSDEAVAYIKSLQPYNRPPGMPLGDSPTWVLHELNRIDKHRKILVRTAVAMNMTRTIVGPASEIVPCEAFRINENRYDAICSGAYKGLKPKLTVKVVFGEEKAGITTALGGIEGLHDFVGNEVLPTLARFVK